MAKLLRYAAQVESNLAVGVGQPHPPKITREGKQTGAKREHKLRMCFRTESVHFSGTLMIMCYLVHVSNTNKPCTFTACSAATFSQWSCSS